MNIRAVFVFAMSLIGTLFAQEFWESKQMTSWSEKETKQLLEDSPWTKKFSFSQVVILEIGRNADAYDRDSNKELWYRAQFWSARPLREARVRSMQIQSKYDQLKPKDKAAFDEKAKGFIETPFSDIVIVRITYGSSVVEFERKMAHYWSSQTMDLQKNKMFLVVEGKRIPILSLQQSPSGSNEFYMIFPRQIDGEPVLSKSYSKVGIEFQHPEITGFNSGTGTTSAPVSQDTAQRVWLEFKPQNMTYHGQLVF
ncbi:MAG TPA: hypothetical protein VMZ25_06980 [Terriglobales bacterium]|nr:hypothetical protein [Terriglobales bacterium]